MSPSSLYHAFNIKDVEYRATRYIGNKVTLKVEASDSPFAKAPVDLQRQENTISVSAFKRSQTWYYPAHSAPIMLQGLRMFILAPAAIHERQ